MTIPDCLFDLLPFLGGKWGLHFSVNHTKQVGVTRERFVIEKETALLVFKLIT